MQLQRADTWLETALSAMLRHLTGQSAGHRVLTVGNCRCLAEHKMQYIMPGCSMSIGYASTQRRVSDALEPEPLFLKLFLLASDMVPLVVVPLHHLRALG